MTTHKPSSLGEALEIRHRYPGLKLLFSENEDVVDGLLLSGLPEIDLCFEDHGHYIFGLNTSITSVLAYLKQRKAGLLEVLKPLTAKNRPDILLGEIFIQNIIEKESLDILAGCKACLKTYDGENGRLISFADWGKESQNSVFQSDELPLIILFPK